MPWKEPPAEVKARVNAVLGGDVYAEAARRYRRVLERLGMAEIPTTEAGSSWYRTAAEHFKLAGAATHSQHLLGLATDWQIRDADLRARVKAALEAEGFTVMLKSRGRVHAQALEPAELARFLPRLRAAGLFAR